MPLNTEFVWWCLIHGNRTWWTVRRARRFIQHALMEISFPVDNEALKKFMASPYAIPYRNNRFFIIRRRPLKGHLFFDEWHQPWLDVTQEWHVPFVLPVWPYPGTSNRIEGDLSEYWISPWPYQKKWKKWLKTRYRLYRVLSHSPHSESSGILYKGFEQKGIEALEASTTFNSDNRKAGTGRSPSSVSENVKDYMQYLVNHCKTLIESMIPSNHQHTLSRERIRSVHHAMAVGGPGYHLQPWAVTFQNESGRSPSVGIHFAWPLPDTPSARPDLPDSLLATIRHPQHWPCVSFWFSRTNDDWKFETVTWGDLHVERWVHPDYLISILDRVGINPGPQTTTNIPHPQLLLIMMSSERAKEHTTIQEIFKRLNALLTRVTEFRVSSPFLPAECILEFLLARSRREHHRPKINRLFATRSDWDSNFGPLFDDTPWWGFMHGHLTRGKQTPDGYVPFWNPKLNPAERWMIAQLFTAKAPNGSLPDNLTSAHRMGTYLLIHSVVQIATWERKPLDASGGAYKVLQTTRDGCLVRHMEQGYYGWIPSYMLKKQSWFFRPALFEWIQRRNRWKLHRGMTIHGSVDHVSTLFHLPAVQPIFTDRDNSVQW